MANLGSAEKKTKKGGYKKLNLQEEQPDEEAHTQKSKKKPKVTMDLQRLPVEPVELRCPLCNYKGETVVKKSFSDRGKVVVFYAAVGVFVAFFFVFILIAAIVYQIVCNKNRGSCGQCCSCKNMCRYFGKFQPKVNSLHYCADCKKQIGKAK